MLRLRRRTPTAVLAAASLMVAAPALGDDPAPIVSLPGGEACEDFGVDVFATSGKSHTRQFTDKAGTVRMITAGTGLQLTFANAETGDTVSLRSNGAVTRTTVHADGTQSVVSTGHNVIILFPSDIPAGPSTTLIVGRVEYTVDAAGVFTVQGVNGRTADICAQLAP